MRLKSLILAVGFLSIAGAAPVVLAAEDAKEPPEQEWHHDGVFGTFDRAALQRGFQVYKEVCAACHSMNLLSYRNLTALGFNEKEVAAIAAEYEIQDGPDDNGEMFTRKRTPADPFNAPYPNEQAARAANNGAYPKDLSLMVKAREHAEDYVYALMTGYTEPPEGVTVGEGMYYNAYFPGGQIAMAPPLTEGGVTFADGTQATIAQQAHDVVTFLTWAAEPHLEARKQMGAKVILFLTVFTAIMYALKRRVWANQH